MEARFEVDKTEQGQALHSRFSGDEAVLVDAVLEHIEAASLMPEQRIIIEVTLLERLDEARQNSSLKEVIGDVATYADAAIAEIGESVRRQRHIGAVTAGLAFCAVIMIVRCGMDLISGLMQGTPFLDCQTALNVGHFIAFVALLLSTRLLVVGDKKASYNDPRKAQRRLQLVGVGVIIALVVMAIPYFDKFVIVQMASVYILAFAVLLLVIWKLSAR